MCYSIHSMQDCMLNYSSSVSTIAPSILYCHIASYGFKDLQGVNFAIAKHRENCIVLYPHIATIAKLKIKE